MHPFTKHKIRVNLLRRLRETKGLMVILKMYILMTSYLMV